MAEEEQATVPAKASGGKKLLIIVIVLVVLLGAGGGAAFMLMGKPAGKAHAAAKPNVKLAKEAQYLPLDPAFVVNFQGNQSHSFLQIGVTLMSHDPKAIEVAKAADPVIRNALVLLFSNQNSDALMTADGKRKLQARALKAVQDVVARQIGRPGIEDLYFTSFVMQ